VTAERHTTAVLGRAQRGEPGDGPHVFADGAGYEEGKPTRPTTAVGGSAPSSGR